MNDVAKLVLVILGCGVTAYAIECGLDAVAAWWSRRRRRRF